MPRPAERSGGPQNDDDPRSWPVRREVSAGGVVIRTAEAGHDVVLVRPRSDKVVWALPKGIVERGETHDAAALREVREETGITATIVEKLEELNYWYTWAPDRARVRKTVHLYLMKEVDRSGEPDAVEIDEVRYVPIARAHLEASYRSERAALKKAAQRVASW